ncbi:MAG: hypothetical protein GY861_14865 [bacterium]|nr:hypothetical protein [bacterium]
MAKSKASKKANGRGIFTFGIVLAVVLGFALPTIEILTKKAYGDISEIVIILLVLVGALVGLMNITSKESMSFLLAAAVLVIVSSYGEPVLSQIRGVGPIFEGILTNLAVFVIPTTIVVALKSIWFLEEDK